MLDYASNPEKTERAATLNHEHGTADLQQALAYTTQQGKTSTETACFVTGVHCDASNAFAEMQAVKTRFGKVSGNVAYHGYQSFLPGEVTPEQAHAIGVQLAEELWGERFQVLIATHLDRAHIHNHFVINAVSYRDGKKFNDNRKTYFDMRAASDRLCAAHSLSVIQNPKGNTPRALYFAEQNGAPTRYNLMREAIDFAICNSTSPAQFRKVLKKEGYLIDANPAHKYPTIRSVNSKKAVRLYRLGEGYSIEELTARIAANPYEVQHGYLQIMRPNRGLPLPTPKHYRLKGSVQRGKKITGLCAVYWRYCYFLGLYPKGKRKPLSPELRAEVRKMERYTRQITLLHQHNLTDEASVRDFLTAKQQEVENVTQARNKLRNKLRRADNPKAIATLKAERDACTTRLARLRREVSTAQQMLADIPQIKAVMQLEDKARLQERQTNRTKKRGAFSR